MDLNTVPRDVWTDIGAKLAMYRALWIVKIRTVTEITGIVSAVLRGFLTTTVHLYVLLIVLESFVTNQMVNVLKDACKGGMETRAIESAVLFVLVGHVINRAESVLPCVFRTGQSVYVTVSQSICSHIVLFWQSFSFCISFVVFIIAMGHTSYNLISVPTLGIYFD